MRDVGYIVDDFDSAPFQGVEEEDVEEPSSMPKKEKFSLSAERRNGLRIF